MKTTEMTDGTGQKGYPRGNFPVRISVKRGSEGCSALTLIDAFLAQSKQKYPLTLLEAATGDDSYAEAVIAVPFPEREHIRIDFNIFASEMEDRFGAGLYFHMESAFE